MKRARITHHLKCATIAGYLYFCLNRQFMHIQMHSGNVNV